MQNGTRYSAGASEHEICTGAEKRAFVINEFAYKNAKKREAGLLSFLHLWKSFLFIVIELVAVNLVNISSEITLFGDPVLHIHFSDDFVKSVLTVVEDQEAFCV